MTRRLSSETEESVMFALGSGAMIVGSLIMIAIALVGFLLWWLL